MKVQRYRVIIEDKGVERATFIDKDSFVVGRTHTADLVINSDLISRKQVRVWFEEGTVWIEDMGSTNGSWVDGTRLTPGIKVPCRASQKVSLGSKLGPFLKIEPQMEKKEATIVNLKRESTQALNLPQVPKFEEREDQEDMIVARVANGPDIMTQPPQAPRREVSNPRISNPNMTASIKRPRPVMKEATAGHYNFEQVKQEAEHKLFDHIRALVGTEAEEIRQASIDEARAIKQEAETEALRVLRAAKEKAEKGIEESETFVKQRMAYLHQTEFETKERVRQLQSTYQILEKKIDELKQQEDSAKHNLNYIQTTIKDEEARIQLERNQLENLRHDLTEEKKRFDIKREEILVEERRIKAKIDTELLEAKLKMTQLQSEADKAQSVLDTLAPEIEALKFERQQQIDGLKNEKAILEEESRDLEVKLRRHQKDLERTTQDYEYITKELNEAKKEHERIVRQNEADRHALLKLERELDLREVETQRNLVQSQNVLSESSSKAKIDAQRIIEEAQNVSRNMLEKVKADVEEANLKRRQLEAEMEIERRKIIDQIETEAEKVKVEKRQEIEELVKKRNFLVSDVENRNRAAKEEYDKIVEAAKADGLVFKRQIENQAITLKDESLAQAQAIKDEAIRYAEETRIKSDQMLEQLKIEVANKKKEALVGLAQLEEKKKAMEKEWQDQKRKQEQIILDTNQRVQEMLDEAQEKTKEIFVQVERDAQEKRRKIDMEMQQDIEKAKIAAKEAMVKIDNETKEYKVKQQALLAELKHVEMMNIKEMRAKAEAEMLERKAEKAKAVATNVYALVASEMYKARNKVIDEEFIKPFTDEMKNLIVDTLLDRVGTDSNKLQEILKTSEDSKAKEKIFWKRASIGGGVLAFILLLIWIFPSIITGPANAIKTSFQDQGDEGSDQFLAQIKEARVKAIFNPPTTPEIKSSYVDNVLYTTDYLTKKQSKAYQDKWILELNEYFISTLDVKDTSIIKFVSLENTLIKDLEKLKADANAQDPNPTIDQMHAREAEFKQRLSELFEDPNKVSRYYNYKKNFWNKFYNVKN